MVLGNKVDLQTERRVFTETAREAAEEFDTIFAEVSAKTGEGIEEVYTGHSYACLQLQYYRISLNRGSGVVIYTNKYIYRSTVKAWRHIYTVYMLCCEVKHTCVFAWSCNTTK